MGHLAVIEGLDGSGKATQATHLAAYLQELGQTVRHVSFPDYDHESSALVKLYLSGKLGSPDEVNAYAASSFYAADRYISFVSHWKKDYDAGYTIIADRYTTSNAAHQMSKLPREEWDDFLHWMEDYEYGRLALPRPSVVIYLDMDPQISHKLLRKRGSPQDIHERDLEYLIRCREAALYACDKLGWRKISCDDGRNPLPVMTIFDQVKLFTMDVSF
ncbi:MAG: dTMP kinase [Oscillospiraceae bacterium]|jgi:dTMP kinase